MQNQSVVFGFRSKLTKGLPHMAWFTTQHGHFLRLSLPEQDLTRRSTVREAFTVAKQVLGGLSPPDLLPRLFSLVPILDRHLRMKPASITLWGYHIYHQMGIPQLLDHQAILDQSARDGSGGTFATGRRLKRRPSPGDETIFFCVAIWVSPWFMIIWRFPKWEYHPVIRPRLSI